MIKSLDLTPNSPHLDFFYEKVYNFYKVSTSKLQEYFVKGLSSLELECMAALSPERRNKEDTPKNIMHLAHSFSKIVDGIAPGYGFDLLNQELEFYQVDDNVGVINKKQSFDSYWGQVAALTEGEGWKVYEVLPRLAHALGTPFNSGSEMERAFSREGDIPKDPKRNT